MTLLYNYSYGGMTLAQAKRSIEQIIDESNDQCLEDFWLIEIDKLTVSSNDRDTIEKLKLYKCTDDDRAKIRYDNILKCLFKDLLKRNWRRLLNNEIVEKYFEYNDRYDDHDDRLKHGLIPRIDEETVETVDDVVNEIIV